MQPLLEPQSVEKALLFVAVVGPLAGLIAGLMIGAHERCAAPKIIIGALIGAIGTAVYGAWRLYGVIANTLGLDSVVNLCVQLALFACLGVVLGFATFGIRKYIRRVGTGR
jgi:hypothetical protein